MNVIASIMDVKKYLEGNGPSITMQEFNAFWITLTDAEKQEYKNNVPEMQKK